MKGDDAGGMAGLWEIWRDPYTGQDQESCTILTTRANALVLPLHDRMPVLLSGMTIPIWLDAVAGKRLPDGFFEPLDARRMKAVPPFEDGTLELNLR
jgi:putative SOS response-associated peptidase YedK